MKFQIIPKNSRARKLFFLALVLLLVAALLWFFTYMFTRNSSKVIYQDAQQRIYLSKKREYKPGRLMWEMAHEDRKTGARCYVLGNSPKSTSEKEMCRRVINTVDHGLATENGGKKSFDSVERIGITITPARSDVHASLVPQKSIGDLIPADLIPKDSDFPVSSI